MRIAVTLAALAMTLPDAANAQANAQPGAPAERHAPTNATEEKKVCRTERMTGSRIRATRICLTRQQWRRLGEVTEKAVDGLLDDANQKLAVQRFGGGGGN